MQTDPTTRFTERAGSYADNRPDYPKELMTLLEGAMGLTPAGVIADVGSGTGMLSEHLLANGNQVYCIEPNAQMRAIAESRLAHYSGFLSIDATAEETGLPSHTVDLVTVAQAFHWFNLQKCRTEFDRILKPGGYVMLVWNFRRPSATPFLTEYEEMLLDHSIDYSAVKSTYYDARRLVPFFGSEDFREETLLNRQYFDFERIVGLLLSSSYAPPPGHPNFEPMMKRLRLIFDRYQENGKVVFDYDTKVYLGRIK